MELTGKKSSEFEDNQQKSSNREKAGNKSLRDVWGNIKRFNIHVNIGVAEKEKNEAEQIFEEIIAKVSQIWQNT